MKDSQNKLIRPASASDLPSIVELNNLVQNLHARNHPKLIKPASEGTEFSDWFVEVIENPDSIVLVVELSGTVVGYIYAEEVKKTASWVSPTVHLLMLHHIGVDSKAQGKGIGKMLMDGMYQEAKKRGVQRVELEVWDFNDNARRFFAGYGFKDLRHRMDVEIEK